MPRAPVTAHWDDAPARRHDVGPMGADWDMLGAAAGCDRVGLRRIRVWPGRQSTPPHSHFGEEEIFAVVRGSGWCWQEDGVYALAEGDVVLHPPGGPAHTIVAGPDGIDVLAFGDNLRHEAARFPRIDAAWAGGIVFDTHAAGPVRQFHLEAERAGAVEIPAQPDPRPETLARLDEVGVVEFRRDRADSRARFVARALGARRTALNHVEIAAGAEAAPSHCHSAIEELFVVVGGDGVLLLGDDEQEHPVRTGSLVCRPAGTGVPHAFRAGGRGMTAWMYSDRDPNDACWYPRSGEVVLRGLGVAIDAAYVRRQPPRL